jgi:hypothetical protein
MAGDVWYEPPTDARLCGFVVQLPRAG